VSLPPPFHTQIVSDTKKVSKEWTSWFQGVAGGGKITQPTVGASPFVYQNTTNIRQQVIVTGGTVSATAVSRDGTNYYTLAVNQAVLFSGDYLKITYTVLPTLTVIPV